MALSGELLKRCRDILQKCAQFESDRSLHAVFITPELTPFRKELPEATTPVERVNLVIDYLLDERLTDGRCVFPIFLQQLSEHCPAGNLLHDDLREIATLAYLSCPPIRRIDVAVPKVVEIGQDFDLYVQVRLPNLPELGASYWPTQEIPSQIEHKSEAIKLPFPVNSEKTELLPLRLKIRIVTPDSDFNIVGSPEKQIELLSNEDSQVVSFRLTAQKMGKRRIDVEFYRSDDVFLEMVPSEVIVELPVFNMHVVSRTKVPPPPNGNGDDRPGPNAIFLIIVSIVIVILGILAIPTIGSIFTATETDSLDSVPPTETLTPTTIPDLSTATLSPTSSPTSIVPTATVEPTLVPANQNKHALWVWQTETITNENAKVQLLNFARSEHINTLYLYAYGLVTSNPAALERFIVEAGDIEVELLAGESSWALAAHHAKVLNFVQDAITFSQNTHSVQHPVGLHFDIEPYLLGAWENDQANVIAQYLDLLVSIREMLTETGSPMLLSVDIPFWFETIEATYNGETKALHQHIQDIVDCVVLMDYRDAAEGNDGIIAHAQDELIYGNQVGTLVTIGLETNCIEPIKITFCEEGKGAMAEEMAKSAAMFKAHSSFHGFAIHDYVGYSALSQQLIPTQTLPPAKTPTATLPPVVPATLSSACPLAEAEGTKPPAVALSAITFIVNDVEQIVDDFSLLRASPGDELSVKKATICVEPFEETGGRVYVEFTPVHSGGVTITSEIKGTHGIPVLPGLTDIVGSTITWTLGSDWQHISVATVHYPVGGGTENLACEHGLCEIDDRMIVSIE
ncbi:MAG: hypothetical protein JXR84_02905 [Anaerolineae bacterium]|nr:hypothetical protein [Anaerolineae bacterium]